MWSRPTRIRVIQRCILMTTDPGDLSPGSHLRLGHYAHTLLSKWGRRWITIDTSRVALASGTGPHHGRSLTPTTCLPTARRGSRRRRRSTRTAPKQAETYGRLRQGFVYERVPHITLKAIANNAEIDVIWERLQPAVETALGRLNQALAGHQEPFAVTAGGRKRRNHRLPRTRRGYDGNPPFRRGGARERPD